MLKTVRRIGCLIPAVGTLAIIGGLLVAGDVAARRYATAQIADRISASVPEATGVHARIQSFPFLGRLAASGHVAEVGAHVDEFTGVHGIAFSNLDVDLRGVVVDTHAMLANRQVRITHIDQGTASVAITQQALTTALGRTVTLTGGQAVVNLIGQRTVTVGVRVTGRTLMLQAQNLPALGLTLPSPKLLPCQPAVTVGEGVVELSCTFTQIPDAFVQAASRLGTA